MNGGWPANPSVDTEKCYIRYRTPQVSGAAATAATFAGTRTSIATMARYQAGSGSMIDATDTIWFSIAEYHGFVDILEGDVLVEIDSSFGFTVVATDENGPRLAVTCRSTGRYGGQ